MRACLLTALFTLCALLGIGYATELIAHRRRIAALLRAMRYLRREIRCHVRPLPDILRECPEPLPLFAQMDVTPPFDLPCAYRRARERCTDVWPLSEEEWQTLDDLFLILGQGDPQEQIRSIDLCSESLERCEKDLRERVERNGKPAIVLGCCAGAFLVLMLL